MTSFNLQRHIRAFAFVALSLLTISSASAQHQLSTITSAHNFIADGNSAGSSGGSGSANSAADPLKYTSPDDCRFYVAPNQDVSLACQLRTVNSEMDTTNFSVIPAEHTVAVSIRCNETTLTRSSLEPGSLAHLARLGELSLEYCKLARLYPDALAGLAELRNLSVRTHNVFWPALSLDIEADAFAHTRQLERLDLSLNNIWSLPEALFCQLSALRTLNMSTNRLQDVSDLGFREKQAQRSDNVTTALPTTTTTTTTTPSATAGSGEASKACALDVELLDVSRNHFVLLPANGFGSLKRLRQLTVRGNEISMVDDRALRGLKQLQVFDLSSNKIVSLPAELFADQAQSIQEIYLQNNSLSLLAPKLFSNLEQLQALDLSSNQITSTWITKATFAGLIRLVLLNLSNNRITRLEPEYFADLYTLQILDLRLNQLEAIQADTFAPMNNLHTLLLSHNNLKYLDAYSLNGLYVLSTAALDNNQLAGVHPEAFRNCSSLQELTMSGNRLTTVPLALKDMRLLRTVDLGENLIAEMGDQSFRGMSNLYGLRLISNQLQNISKQVFKELPNLQILNLAHNRIDRIEPGAFEQMPGIQAIRVDGNRLQSLGGLFSHTPLMWLNISDNQLTEFDYAEIPAAMLWLDLHANAIGELADQFGVHSQLRLQTMDASFNRLRKITPTSVPNSIELLFLNDNWITAVEEDTFLLKHNLTRVDLYANQIESLDKTAMKLQVVPAHRALPDFYVGGNPFVCDCTIEWMQKINRATEREYPRIMDVDTIYCKLLNNPIRPFISLLDAEPSHLLCPYESHCFSTCHCCAFDACDCELLCPTNCTCFHDQSWSTNIIQCSAAGISDIPPEIPLETTELRIDGNSMAELGGNYLLNRKSLLVLRANGSNIQTVLNTTFLGLSNLLRLHLENNRIARLAGDEFQELESLRELYLQNNRLTFIDARTFGQLHALEVLRLENNKLMHFEVWQLVHNPYIAELGLADNMWSCECGYRTQWRAYVGTLGAKAVDAARILCVSNNATKPMIEGSGAVDEVCIEGNSSSGDRRSSSATVAHTSAGGPAVVDAAAEHMQPMLSFVLAASCALVGFAGMLLGAWCYRRELNDWWRAGCTGGLCYKSAAFHHPDDFDKDRLYDAYVSYSQQDEHFVSQVLAQQLEQTVGYRLCLHYRDFGVNTYVADTIVEAVDSSRRTLLVLSRNFLYNEWSRFEVKSALHECVKRNRKLVFILYGDLPQRDIDADMRMYLRASTCIEWEDKKFWPKLRAAMPQLRGLGRSASAASQGGNCMAKRSAVNIYATSTNGPMSMVPSHYGQQHAAPMMSTMGRAGMLPPMPGHVVDYHTGRRVVPMAPVGTMMMQANGGGLVDCNNYATINDCGRNCDKYESVLCKYSSTTERQRGKHQLQQPQAATMTMTMNANVAAMRAQQAMSKTLDRQFNNHHEYAVPSNLLGDGDSGAGASDEEELSGAAAAAAAIGHRFNTGPPRTPARTPGRARPVVMTPSGQSSSASGSGASLPSGNNNNTSCQSSSQMCNNCADPLCAGDERCVAMQGGRHLHDGNSTSASGCSVTGSLNSTLAAGDAMAAGRSTLGGGGGGRHQQQQQMWA